MPIRKRKKPAKPEHLAQCAVMQWSLYNLGKHPELKLLFAIPNGGSRHPAEAVNLKKEGVKAGVLDLFLPVARKGYHGLFIEMKIKPNKPSKEQEQFVIDVVEQGYQAHICYSAEDAIKVLKNYLN